MGQSSARPPELIIVTGAGRGIGHAIAIEMARIGAAVVCISRTKSCHKTAAMIRARGGTADAIVADLADYSKTEKAVARFLKGRRERRIGIVLAAGSLGPSGPLWKTPLADWDAAWRTNVLGNLAVVRACLPKIRANRFGRILFFAGGGAAYAYPLFPAYAIAKTALVREVENLHEDLKDAGDFAVAIVAPGAVETRMLAAVRKKGGEVRTTVGIEEPVTFARVFLSARHCGFSGHFVHVRDNWRPLLEPGATPSKNELWKLRRIE
ncbi:MAG TPA: SDR family oxidoreductase [Candidatus Binataceae bacterium]|nr:SDR family oxidoreductase [Candidatus Binataceae bacterium]